MAYFRGENYIWDDESGLHIWAKDGYDSWDEASWCCYADDADVEKSIRIDGYENASGVSISMDVMDEYVVMRLAQMLKEGIAIETIDRVVNDSGNFGSLVLKRNAEVLKAALAPLKLVEPEPDFWKTI